MIICVFLIAADERDADGGGVTGSGAGAWREGAGMVASTLRADGAGMVASMLGARGGSLGTEGAGTVASMLAA